MEEAKQLRATAIVMPLPPRQAGSVFGKTLETVLQDRPCRVIIHTDAAAPASLRAGEAPPASPRIYDERGPCAGTRGRSMTSTGRNLHRSTTTFFSVVLVLLGVGMIVRALTGGGGALAVGVVLGVLFVLAGGGRIYLARRTGA